jgi:hypothetical protein
MPRILAILLVLVPVAFAAGRWSSAEDEAPPDAPATVRAQSYRIVWADSALDLSHGGGRWVHEIFFPDLEVAAAVVFEQVPVEGEELSYESRPRLHVWRADGPRSDLTGFDGGAARPPAEITVIEVPADLAKAIAAFAELSDRYRAEGSRMGQATATVLGFEDLGPVR